MRLIQEISNGDYMFMSGYEPATQDEVMHKIISNTIMDMKTDCALWQGYCTGGGYGTISWQGKQVPIHRLLYQWFVDPSVDIVRHTCDTPNCWNLSHLIGGSTEDNVQDKVDRERQPRGISHGRARLTEDDVREIRHSSLPVIDLVIKFDIARSLVYKIRNRENWKHVKD